MDTSIGFPKKLASDLIRMLPEIRSRLNEVIKEENAEQIDQQHKKEDAFAKQMLTEVANRKGRTVGLDLKTVAELSELFTLVGTSLDKRSYYEERIALPKVISNGVLRSLEEIYFIGKGPDNEDFVPVPKRTTVALVRLLSDIEVHYHKQANNDDRYDYTFEEPDAAFYCGCSVSNLQKFRKEGLVKFFRYRRHVRYHKLDLDHFLVRTPNQQNKCDLPR